MSVSSVQVFVSVCLGLLRCSIDLIDFCKLKYIEIYLFKDDNDYTYLYVIELRNLIYVFI